MKNKIFGILLLLIMLVTGGCQGRQNTDRASEEANVYRIYYLNSSLIRLAPWEYRAEATDRESLIQELMTQFLNVPNDVDSQVALSDKVGYLGYQYQPENQVVYLYFDLGYTNRANMDSSREIL